MGIKLGCPKCGKDFDIHPALAGQPLDCPDCGNTFIVPSSAPAVESNDRDPIRKKVPQVPCPKCGTQYIVEGAPSKIEIECESCGHRFTKSKRKKRKATSALPIGQIAGNSPKDVPVQPKPQSGSFFNVKVVVVIGGLGVLLFIMVGLLLRERTDDPRYAAEQGHASAQDNLERQEKEARKKEIAERRRAEAANALSQLGGAERLLRQHRYGSLDGPSLKLLGRNYAALDNIDRGNVAVISLRLKSAPDERVSLLGYDERVSLLGYYVHGVAVQLLAANRPEELATFLDSGGIDLIGTSDAARYWIDGQRSKLARYYARRGDITLATRTVENITDRPRARARSEGFIAAIAFQRNGEVDSKKLVERFSRQYYGRNSLLQDVFCKEFVIGRWRSNGGATSGALNLIQDDGIRVLAQLEFSAVALAKTPNKLGPAGSYSLQDMAMLSCQTFLSDAKQERHGDGAMRYQQRGAFVSYLCKELCANDRPDIAEKVVAGGDFIDYFPVGEWIDIGIAYATTGKLDEALRIYRYIVPKYRKCSTLLVELLAEIVRSHVRSGKADAAEKFIDTISDRKIRALLRHTLDTEKILQLKTPVPQL